MVISGRERLDRRVVIRWSPNQNHLPSTICFLYTILSCSFFLNCCARDTITVNTLLRDGETLVSAGERFELGFFPTAETSDIGRYVGIWYYNSNPQVYVWVANRDEPLPDATGVVAIADDGNLKLVDKNGSPYWNTEINSSSSANLVVAKLMDSGNLVLTDGRSGASLWQSFEHPTDTFLAGMKMDEKLTLTSWLSKYNPGSGNFTFKMNEAVNQYLIYKRHFPFWSSGNSGEFFSSDEMPSVITYLLSNFSPTARSSTASKSTYSNLTDMSTKDYSNTRLIMNSTGQIQYWSKDKVKGWSLIWGEPRDRCSRVNFCGNFGSCDSNNKLECKCLPGFVPSIPEKWKNGDFSDGCTRKSEICGENDKFLLLKMMKVGNPDAKIPDSNETECSKECHNNCQCQAYAYGEAKNSPRRGDPTTAATCWLWTEDLNSLQEEYYNGGRDLYVRVNASDLGSATERNCANCGTNPIPYPLSTETNCGDPSYFSFHCDSLTGQVSFKALNHNYRVTRINPDTRTFSIQMESVDHCDARNSRQSLQLNKSLPFSVTSWCDAGLGNSSSYVASQAKQAVEIAWALPSEPTCISERDCKNWPHSTCKLTGNRERRCLCNDTFQWDALLLNCTQENGYTKQVGGGYTKQEGKKQWNLIVGVTVTVAGVIILSCIIVYFYLRRKKVKGRDGESLRQNMAVRFKDSARHVKDLVETDQFSEEDKKGIDLPFFDFESILAATDNFLEANKLGKGGFGPVYKGKFPGGQEIAVKRLSSVSGQGLEEFRNEVVLIARLQHRNLVRLLGYCIEGGEKILLYEYMPNKSLDAFIYHPTHGLLLDWEMRFNIILGIARGLLYLHQDSRLRVIHRDLKTSNILLDQEMNPKISDFGLARIFEGKQTEGNTNRVVGTYGYMSPEYALDGIFSVKSDVFSFGVIVLEIVSGRRNTGFYNSEEALSLIGYAWRLWQEDKALDIMDQNLNASLETNEILKCITIGLLCVQEDPNDRPNMSNVVIMLGSESERLPTPKRPAFFIRGGPSTSVSSYSTKPEINAELTASLVGR